MCTSLYRQYCACGIEPSSASGEDWLKKPAVRHGHGTVTGHSEDREWRPRTQSPPISDRPTVPDRRYADRVVIIGHPQQVSDISTPERRRHPGDAPHLGRRTSEDETTDDTDEGNAACSTTT